MQVAYRVRETGRDSPPVYQRVAYPDGTPIADVAKRMGWVLEPPADAIVLSETGAVLVKPVPAPRPKTKTTKEMSADA